LFVPIKDKIILLICLFGSKTPRPQLLLPVKSPLPHPSEATIRSLICDYLTALIKFIGTPHNPKPPANMKDPFSIPLIASKGLLHIFEKQLKFFKKRLLNIVINYRKLDQIFD
jgi:hypothetical protein